MALADLVASASVWYPLDEASGNAIDGIGSLDLTDTNTVGAGSGPGTISWSRDFESGSSEYFTRADAAAFSTGDIDFTIRCIVNLESLGCRPIVGKWNSGAGNKEYFLLYDNGTLYGTNRFTFVMDPVGDTSTQTVIQDGTGGAASTSTWYHLVAAHSAGSNQLKLSVNGNIVTASHTHGGVDTGSGFQIGSSELSSPFSLFFDGLITDVVLLKGAYMSDAEIAEDYNGGDPIPFANWAGGEFDAQLLPWLARIDLIRHPTFAIPY